MRRESVFLTKIIINMIAFAIVASLFSGVIIDNLVTLIAVSVLFGILNAFLKPFLTIVTLPITVTTFGIFYLILNAFYVWITQAVVKGFVVHSFATAFWAAIVLSVVSFFIEMIFFNQDNVR